MNFFESTFVYSSITYFIKPLDESLIGHRTHVTPEKKSTRALKVALANCSRRVDVETCVFGHMLSKGRPGWRRELRKVANQ